MALFARCGPEQFVLIQTGTLKDDGETKELWETKMIRESFAFFFFQSRDNRPCSYLLHSQQ